MAAERTFIGEAIHSSNNVCQAYKFMREHGMMKIYVIIFVLMAILFYGSFGLAEWLSEMVGEYFGSMIKAEEGESLWSALSWVLNASGWLMTWALTLLLTYLLSGYIILMVLSPIFSYVAEASLKIINGEDTPFSMHRFIWSIIRGIFILTINATLQLLVTIVLLLIGLIPSLVVITAPMIFIVDAYFMGMSTADYTFEAYNMSIKDSWKYAWRNKGRMIGIGLPYTLSLKIPFIGKYIGLLVAPLCVVGACTTIMNAKDIVRRKK